MFAGLMQLGKQYYNPKKFCLSFKDIDNQPIDPYVQKDCDEFFIMLIDRIENLIKGTKEEQVMKNLMHGVFANELICKGCPHTSEREEPFMAVQIQVKDKNSILEGLDAFVQGEMLEGDNAYFCEKCDMKRDTLRR
jgi:ubiquitin C-terminal hydrolase